MRCLTSGLRDLTALHELICIPKKARQLERKENVALRHVLLRRVIFPLDRSEGREVDWKLQLLVRPREDKDTFFPFAMAYGHRRT